MRDHKPAAVVGVLLLLVVAAFVAFWVWPETVDPVLRWLHIIHYGDHSTYNEGWTTRSCWGVERRPHLAIFRNCG
jgi:hypothetical protein